MKKQSNPSPESIGAVKPLPPPMPPKLSVDGHGDVHEGVHITFTEANVVDVDCSIEWSNTGGLHHNEDMPQLPVPKCSKHYQDPRFCYKNGNAVCEVCGTRYWSDPKAMYAWLAEQTEIETEFQKLSRSLSRLFNELCSELGINRAVETLSRSLRLVSGRFESNEEKTWATKSRSH